MNIRDCKLKLFVKEIQGRRLWVFGAGKKLKHFLVKYPKYALETRIYSLVDQKNDQGVKAIELNQSIIPVISFASFLTEYKESDVVLIGIAAFYEILDELENLKQLEQTDVYILTLLENQELKSPKIDLSIYQRGEMKIPKIIHYCWFGKSEIPDQLKEYMDSWKRYCPDYEVIRWDESNYDVTKNNYMKEAYEHKKYSFVSDYARLDLVYQMGGIFMDTDVELLKSLDELLYFEGFFGYQSDFRIATGLAFGAVKHHGLIKTLMEDYQNRSFLKEDKSLDLTVCPVFQSKVLESLGKKLDNRFEIWNQFAFLPYDFLNGIDLFFEKSITSNTFSIHHYAGTWKEVSQREAEEKRRERLKQLVRSKK